MYRHIDITFDFETVSTAPDAAPMQLAAVAWDRFSNGDHPFLDAIEPFNVGIDLRWCVMNGFDFDQDTIAFWQRQSIVAKKSVLSAACYPLDEVLYKFVSWIDAAKKSAGADTVCLWCQGQDFDFPILKTIVRRCGSMMPAHQHYFRDCRTVVLENVLAAVVSGATTQQPTEHVLTFEQIMDKPMRAYDLIPPLPANIVAGRVQHDAVYDCLRSSWSVWQSMKLR